MDNNGNIPTTVISPAARALAAARPIVATSALRLLRNRDSTTAYGNPSTSRRVTNGIRVPEGHPECSGAVEIVSTIPVTTGCCSGLVHKTGCCRSGLGGTQEAVDRHSEEVDRCRPSNTEVYPVVDVSPPSAADHGRRSLENCDGCSGHSLLPLVRDCPLASNNKSKRCEMPPLPPAPSSRRSATATAKAMPGGQVGGEKVGTAAVAVPSSTRPPEATLKTKPQGTMNCRLRGPPVTPLVVPKEAMPHVCGVTDSIRTSIRTVHKRANHTTSAPAIAERRNVADRCHPMLSLSPPVVAVASDLQSGTIASFEATTANTTSGAVTAVLRAGKEGETLSIAAPVRDVGVPSCARDRMQADGKQVESDAVGSVERPLGKIAGVVATAGAESPAIESPTVSPPRAPPRLIARHALSNGGSKSMLYAVGSHPSRMNAAATLTLENTTVAGNTGNRCDRESRAHRWRDAMLREKHDMKVLPTGPASMESIDPNRVVVGDEDEDDTYDQNYREHESSAARVLPSGSSDRGDHEGKGMLLSLDCVRVRTRVPTTGNSRAIAVGNIWASASRSGDSAKLARGRGRKGIQGAPDEVLKRRRGRYTAQEAAPIGAMAFSREF